MCHRERTLPRNHRNGSQKIRTTDHSGIFCMNRKSKLLAMSFTVFISDAMIYAYEHRDFIRS